MKFRAIFLLCMVCLLTLTTPVSAEDAAEAPVKQLPSVGDPIVPNNYANPDNWLHVAQDRSKPVDVFYIYPTVWAPTGENTFPLCPITYPPMRNRAKLVYAVQATAFNTVGNMVAPYYRQVSVEYTSSNPPLRELLYYRDTTRADITAAFDYFITHINDGRPFILVGHSQGALQVKGLLFGYLKEHPEVLKRMVAAYVIGLSVTKGELATNPHLKFAEGPDDTGVIISYNTEAPGYTGKNFTLLPGAQVINPITWTRTEEPAPASQNLGSLVPVDGAMQKVMGFADAKLDLARGVVVCSTVDPVKYSAQNGKSTVFPPGVFHVHDIGFYYFNLRANAENRARIFLENQHP